MNRAFRFPSRRTFSLTPHFLRTAFPILFLLGSWLAGIPLTAQNCTLVCNDPDPASPLQVAVGDNCESILDPDNLLESPQSCPGPKQMTVRDGQSQIVTDGIDLISFDGAPYIGETLSVTVTDTTTGIFCVSYIRIVDNLPPTITCQDQIISCVGDTSIAVTGLPLAMDNCDDDLTLTYTDDFVIGDCLNGNAAVLTREWIATDDSGNADTCVQIIFLERPDLAGIIFPANVTLDCEAPDTSVPANGRPTLDGVDLLSGGICDLTVGFTTDTNYICGNIEYSLLRTWTITDNCTDQTVSEVQFIEVRDETPPLITCPANLTVNTFAGQCFGTVTLPAATATDNCDPQPDIVVNTSYGATGLGPHPFVPAGQHNIQYYAVDECGNSSICTITLTIQDSEAPTAVCEDFLTVSVPSGGLAVVNALSFDEGSADNCQDTVYHKVRRMTTGACNGANGDDSDMGGYQEWFDDQVIFCCEEHDADSLFVVLHAYEVDPGSGPVDPVRELPGGDLFGHFTECMVTVDVQDKIKPVISCPADQTITCTDDYSDLSIFGSPNLSDNCSAILDSTHVTNLSDCGVGAITRTWTATDPSGNASSCMQTITIINDSPFDESLIDWPDNYTTDVCGAPVDPEDLPGEFSEPGILGDGCGVIVYNYSDQIFNTAPPACYKVLREWVVIDWCQYDPENADGEGRYSHIQTIKVQDNDDPVITCPDDVTVAVGADCETATITLDPVTGQDCSPDLLITNDSPYANGGGADAGGEYPLGTTVVTYNLSDRCGNVATCQVTVTVEDQTTPAPVCLVGLSVNISNMNGNLTAQVNANAFDGGSIDNCTPPANLKRRIRPADADNPPGPPTTNSLTFTCDDVGSQLIEFWVIDEQGNSDFCVTFITVQDNNGVCPMQSTGMIAGGIETEEGEYVENVQVSVMGDDPVLDFTDLAGHFEFPNMPFGDNYTLVPSRTDGQLNGVTTLDLVLMSRHILGTAPLDSPYKIIAADINRSGSISTFDLIKLQKMILGIDNEFPNGNQAWRFVEESFVFPDPSNPFVGYFPETYNINNLNNDENSADFVAIKVGDVNLSAQPNTLLGVDERITYGAFELETTDRELYADETVTVDFQASGLPEMAGFQFTLLFDPGRLELLEWLPGDLPGMTADNFGLQDREEGYLTASWYETGAGLPERATLFRLTFRARRPGKLSDLLQIGSARTAAEAYDQDLLPLAVTLNFPEGRMTDEFELYQNRPNPFRDQTLIGFNLPQAGRALLTVYDMAGKTIYTRGADFDAGYNEFIVSGADLPSGGVLYYSLESDRFKETRKMVLMGKP